MRKNVILWKKMTVSSSLECTVSNSCSEVYHKFKIQKYKEFYKILFLGFKCYKSKVSLYSQCADTGSSNGISIQRLRHINHPLLIPFSSACKKNLDDLEVYLLDS